MNSLLALPHRPKKPRDSGLTMVLDSGLGSHGVSDLIEMAGDLADFAKLGWGTAMITKNLEKKLAMYQEAGITPFLGGTFFELAFLHGKVDEFSRYVEELGLGWVEISNGTVDMNADQKTDCIRELSKNFFILSEVGGKDSDVIEAPKIWVERIQAELEAGARIIITEGRESGDSGLYRRSHELRTGLVDEIVDTVSRELILWEAPLRHQQAWFIKRFGSNVNLGNIAPGDVLNLETLRLGLRSDTMETFHSPSAAPKTMASPRDFLIETIASITETNKADIVPGAPLNQLPRFDSLAHVQLLNELERRFSIKVTLEEELEHFKSVDSLTAYLESKVSSS